MCAIPAMIQTTVHRRTNSRRHHGGSLRAVILQAFDSLVYVEPCSDNTPMSVPSEAFGL